MAGSRQSRPPQGSQPNGEANSKASTGPLGKSPWGLVLFALSRAVRNSEYCRKRHVDEDGGEDDRAEIAVRAKAPQAVVGIGGIERRDLPGKLSGRRRHAYQERHPGMGHDPRRRDGDNGEGVENGEKGVSGAAEAE